MSTKTHGDEAALIADLNATFPNARATSLRKWSGNPEQIGAVVNGEAEIEPGYAIGPYIPEDDESYNGSVHRGFEAWCKARGWYVETYEYGTLWVVPLPSQQFLDEWRAFNEDLANQKRDFVGPPDLPF